MDPYEELARRAGLVLDHVGRKAIERVDLASPTALEQAAEILAVPETWFFRDGQPFVYLAQFAVSAPRPLRVLSAPCATGEEPYSIAIALLEAGLAPGEFTIDAVDISAHAIAAAGRAVYGKSSFRHPMPGLIEKYFDSVGQSHHLHADVAAQVHFRRANLLEDLGPDRPYHAVFCRNLLIYLHEGARKSVIATMRGLLATDGLLFAGHSEITLFLEAGFRKVEHPRSFACRAVAPAPPWACGPPIMMKALPIRAGTIRAATVRERLPRRVSQTLPDGRGSDGPGSPTERSSTTGNVGQAGYPGPPVDVRIRAKTARERSSATNPPEPGLDDARRLADQGRLAEAAALCTRLSPTAEVYFLQGLISQSSDRLAEAEEHFRKALYLDPGHREALVHMSLLCASCGDNQRSAVFRDRAARLRAPSTTEAP